MTATQIVNSVLRLIRKGLIKGLEDLEIGEQVEIIQNTVLIGQNTKRSPGDLTRLAVTQITLKNYLIKNSKSCKIIKMPELSLNVLFHGIDTSTLKEW